MSTLNDALKPCPMCGSDAEAASGFSPLESVTYAFCTNLDCRLHDVDVGFTPSSWNTRTTTLESSAAQGATGDDYQKRASERVQSQIRHLMECCKTDANGWLSHRTELARDKLLTFIHQDHCHVAQPSDATAQPSVDLTDERAAFEAWWISQPHRCKPEQFNDGMYKYPAAYAAWNVWQARAALANTSQAKTTEPCKTCSGTGIVDDGYMTHSGGIEFENGPIKCVKDCPDCALAAKKG